MFENLAQTLVVPSIYSSARTGSEHTVLLSQAVDHILLLAVERASQNEE